MNYQLNNNEEDKSQKKSFLETAKSLWPFLAGEKNKLLLAAIAILINSGLTLLAPLLVGITIDKFIVTKQFNGVLLYSGILLIVYIATAIASYTQTILTGGIGQRLLFSLRNAIFNKLQELPIAFFNQNKAGDLISRINNDTDKLNQFFAQSLVQFVNNAFIIAGAGIFIVVINPKLGSAALLPALGLLILTRILGGWVKRKNTASLQATGEMSAEIQESLNNFKVIVAFNRRDYFRVKFQEANQKNYVASVGAGIANGLFMPVFDFAGNLAQLIVLSYGIYLTATGNFTIGLLIGFLSYTSRFYDPLRQVASLWTTMQIALAAWNRIAQIINLKSDLPVLPVATKKESSSLLEFKNVTFTYPSGKEVLHNISFKLEKGKKYALVGPTGGGKTTTASLMARLYDPTQGIILLDGQDLRSFEPSIRAQKIGFILQEPFLFTGTVKDNIIYGNSLYTNYTEEQLVEVLKSKNLEELIAKFDQGLQTRVTTSGDTISLGQKQLIAFIRAVLRNPELLILDEATANIDTVTEQILEDILKKLPKETTLVVIAHRLNTIENADEIFFVNSGEIISAGSLDNAVDLLLHGKRVS